MSRATTLFDHGLTSIPGVKPSQTFGTVFECPLGWWFPAGHPEASKLIKCTVLRWQHDYKWTQDRQRADGCIFFTPDDFDLKEDKQDGWEMQLCVFEKFLHAYNLREQALAASKQATAEALLGGSPLQTREQLADKKSTTPQSRKRLLGQDHLVDTPRPKVQRQTRTPSVGVAFQASPLAFECL